MVLPRYGLAKRRTPPPVSPAALKTLRNTPVWRSGVLTGSFVGTIPTVDATTTPHQDPSGFVVFFLWVGGGGQPQVGLLLPQRR